MRDRLATKLADPELYERPGEAVVWQTLAEKDRLCEEAEAAVTDAAPADAN